MSIEEFKNHYGIYLIQQHTFGLDIRVENKSDFNLEQNNKTSDQAILDTTVVIYELHDPSNEVEFKIEKEEHALNVILEHYQITE